MSKKILTFEYDEAENMLEIHANTEGLDELIAALSRLRRIENKNDHEHLNTPDWGGKELTSEKQCEANKLFHNVKVFRWKDD